MARERSLAALFHEAGEDETTGPVLELYDLHKIAEQKDREKEIGEATKHLEEILRGINDVGLETADSRQQSVLEKQKNTARELLNNVIECAKKYIDVIMQADNYKRGKGHLDQKNYLEGLKKMDETREQKHNLLIDAINIANRYIILHFSKLKDDDLDKFIENEADAGREVIDVERIKLPSSGVCTRGVNLRNRKSITNWAHILTSELADYKKISGREYSLPL